MVGFGFGSVSLFWGLGFWGFIFELIDLNVAFFQQTPNGSAVFGGGV